MSGLTAEERYLFDLNGFVVRHDVLPASLVDALDRAVDALGAGPPGPTVASQRFVGLVEAGGPFLTLLDHDAVVGVLPELIGPRFRLDHAYGIQMRPQTSGLALHGGGTPFDPSQYYVWSNGRAHSGLVAVLWGVSASGPGDGGFCCIPGSHKANVALPKALSDCSRANPLLVGVPLPPGSMLVFTEALTHGTMPWTGGGDRRVLAYKYSPGHVAWSRPKAYTDEVLRGMTPRQRALLEPPYVSGRRAEA